MSRGKYKKLYYLPGLISLVLLPLLLASWGKQKHEELNKASIELNLFSPSPQDTVLRRFYHFDRSYEKVILGANKEENKVRLAYAEQRLLKMIEDNDSTTGIHISFSDAKYAAYIDALDVTNRVESLARLIDKDGIKCYNRWRSKGNFWVCGGVIFVDQPLPELSFLEKLKSIPSTTGRRLMLLSDTFKEFWLSLSLFSALVALGLVKCFRAIKTST